MHEWQLCHLAMVVPIADAYYAADNPEKAGTERKLMYQTAERMKSNFCTLYQSGVILSPKKMNLFRLLPTSVLSIVLKFVFQSNFGYRFMYKHSMNAPDEMQQLHQQFYRYMERK